MMQSVGEQLRDTRQSRKITLDQAAQATHINPKYLQAIEEDNLDILPSKVQGRGFLRLYSDFLGMPSQPLLDQWNGITLPPTDAYTQEYPDEKETEIEHTSGDNSEDLNLNETIIVSDTFPSLDQITEIANPQDEYSQNERNDIETPTDTDPDTSNNSSEFAFQTIGEQLHYQRSKLNLTLEEIEKYTHIRTHYLHALEEGNISQLPSTVQGRGMLKNYALFLNLDADELLLKFANGLQLRRLEISTTSDSQTPKYKKKQIKEASLLKKLITPDLVIGGTIIILLVVIITWIVAQISADNQPEIAATSPSIAEVLLNTSTANPTTSTTPTTENPVSTPNQMALQGEQEQFVENAQGEQEEFVENAETENNSDTLPPQNDLPLQLHVTANQRAWMRIIADNQIAFNGRVSPGNAYQFSASENLELHTGNAAALHVKFNQSDLGILGIVGQVAHITFSQEGIITPTLENTPTFTSTPEITTTVSPTPTIFTATVTPFIP